MHTRFLIPAALAALTVPCLAQDFIGYSYNCQVGATSRGSIGTAAGEVMTRIDGRHHAGWGTNTPGFRTITALFLIAQDQDAVNTPEVFDIRLYPEDPNNLGYPDLNAGVTYATGIPGPTTGNPIGAVALTVPPTTPGTGDSVPIQGNGSVFVSFVLPANAGWPATDGMSINIVLGFAPNASFTVFDTPGLAQGGTPPPTTAASNPSNSHGLYRIGAGAALYSQRRQMFLDVAHSTSGGTALAITNQTSFTASNNPPPTGWGPAPGTASMMSGTNPDVVGGNAGRVDDITMEFFRTGIGTGALVVFLMDLAPAFAPEIPLSVFLPGSTGVVCLNSSAATLGIGFTNNNEAWFTTTIPLSVRPSLSNLPVKQQAIALDASGVGHASPCDGMVF